MIGNLIPFFQEGGASPDFRLRVMSQITQVLTPIRPIVIIPSQITQVLTKTEYE